MCIPGRAATVVIALLMLVVGALLGYGAGVSEVRTATYTYTYTLVSSVTVARTVVESITIPTALTQTIATTVTKTIVVPIEVYGSRILILATLGQTIVASPWEVAIANVSEGPCLKVYRGFGEEWIYYRASPGMKFVAVTTIFRNAGDYEANLNEFATEFEERLEYHRTPLIATDAGNTYWLFEELHNLEQVKSPSEAKALNPLCIAVRNMFPSAYILKPGEVSVESMIFVVPKDEKPVELLMIRMLKDPRLTLKTVIAVKLVQVTLTR
jgi:hypothetical protein